MDKKVTLIKVVLQEVLVKVLVKNIIEVFLIDVFSKATAIEKKMKEVKLKAFLILEAEVIKITNNIIKVTTLKPQMPNVLNLNIKCFMTCNNSNILSNNDDFLILY